MKAGQTFYILKLTSSYLLLVFLEVFADVQVLLLVQKITSFLVTLSNGHTWPVESLCFNIGMNVGWREKNSLETEFMAKVRLTEFKKLKNIRYKI